MRIRVTKAVTKYGRYYAAGEIIDNPGPLQDSLRRTHGWEILPDSAPSLAGLTKPQLVEIAHERGLDVAGLNKSELRRLLES